MGLDMTLYGAVEAPAGSRVATVIEEVLTERDREHIGDPEWDTDGMVYIGGWDFRLHEGYKPLCMELGFEPPPDDPHLYLKQQGDDWLVKPVVYHWRKAYAINQWFEDKCGSETYDGGEVPVHPEMLMDLLDRVERIHANPSLAPSLLPCQVPPGFEVYGPWFIEEIGRTVIDLKAQVALLMPLRPKFYYTAN